MNNDLIRRSDIKTHISELMLVYSGEELDNAILNAINNASTVEPYKEKDEELKEAYKLLSEAYEHEVTKEERPQGEWLWLCDTPNAKYKWSCNKCGRGVKEQENYCPNCGAQMTNDTKQ